MGGQVAHRQRIFVRQRVTVIVGREHLPVGIEKIARPEAVKDFFSAPVELFLSDDFTVRVDAIRLHGVPFLPGGREQHKQPDKTPHKKQEQLSDQPLAAFSKRGAGRFSEQKRLVFRVYQKDAII